MVPFHEVLDSEEVASEEQMKVKSPPGQGWWLVIASQTEVHPRPEKPTNVFLVCGYQLLSDGSVMSWWIYLDPWTALVFVRCLVF